jgi:hypothetical protein
MTTSGSRLAMVWGAYPPKMTLCWGGFWVESNYSPVTPQVPAGIGAEARKYMNNLEFYGARYWDRTSGPRRVKAMLYR